MSDKERIPNSTGPANASTGLNQRKFKPNRAKFRKNRRLDENDLDEFQNLVNWRTSYQRNPSSSSISTSSPINNTNPIPPNKPPQKSSQSRQHHHREDYQPRTREYYPEIKSSYQINYNKMASYSFSIELTEYDFEVMNQGYGQHLSSSSCLDNGGDLDDELEIYLKGVYAKSEAVLDMHAQHLALAAERSKQSATERWLLSRTPEERNRYLQSRNMTTQF
jgi:hypothetical protein